MKRSTFFAALTAFVITPSFPERPTKWVIDVVGTVVNTPSGGWTAVGWGFNASNGATAPGFDPITNRIGGYTLAELYAIAHPS